MFEGDHVLRVGKLEDRPSTDRFFDPLLALGVARLNTAMQFARSGAVPRDVQAFG